MFLISFPVKLFQRELYSCSCSAEFGDIDDMILSIALPLYKNATGEVSVSLC